MIKPGKEFAPNCFFIHDFIEPNGKTIKENNLEKNHAIPLGSLVEINGYDGFYYNGCRLYVVDYSRDCDGSCLYLLGPKGATESYKRCGGFGETSLTIIEEPK